MHYNRVLNAMAVALPTALLVGSCFSCTPPVTRQPIRRLPLATTRCYETTEGPKAVSWIRHDLTLQQLVVVAQHEAAHRRQIERFPSCAAHDAWAEKPGQALQNEAEAFCASIGAALEVGIFPGPAEAVEAITKTLADPQSYPELQPLSVAEARAAMDRICHVGG